MIPMQQKEFDTLDNAYTVIEGLITSLKAAGYNGPAMDLEHANSKLIEYIDEAVVSDDSDLSDEEIYDKECQEEKAGA